MSRFGFGFISAAALVETLFDRTTGTNFGDMTASGGLLAAFDGNLSQSNGSAAIKGNAGPSGGHVGKDTATASPVSKIVVRSTNNIGLSNSGAVTLYLYASNSMPSSGTNGTLLGSLALGSSGANSTDYTVDSNDKATPYRYIWLYITSSATGGDVYCAELSIYVMK